MPLVIYLALNEVMRLTMNIYEGRWRLANGTEVYLSRYSLHFFIVTGIYNSSIYHNVYQIGDLFYNEQGQCVQHRDLKKDGTDYSNVCFRGWDVKELIEKAKVENKINNAILCLSCTE